MRQKINLTPLKLDKVAEQAHDLSDWLEEKAVATACRVNIPPEMATVGAFVIAASLLFLFEDPLGDGLCWHGGCDL